jgi:uncharacterized protein (TIGR03435 family)
VEASSVRSLTSSSGVRLIRKRIGLLCCCSLLAPALSTTTAAAQDPSAFSAHTFEVASIKPSGPDFQLPRIRILPGGRFEVVQSTLRDIIRWAYGAAYFDPIEADSRILNQQFDIVALAADRSVSPEPAFLELDRLTQYQSMVQRLLSDRFGLVVRRETRALAGYALVMARSDRRLGPSLRPSAIDCAALRPRVAAGDPQALAAVAPPAAGQAGPCNIIGTRNRTQAGGHTMAEFANALSMFVLRQPVEDRTGLEGPFAIDIVHAPLTVASATPEADLPPLMIALREQLGLALEAIETAVEAVIIERVGPLVDD